jgi:hypothetical protein
LHGIGRKTRVWSLGYVLFVLHFLRSRFSEDEREWMNILLPPCLRTNQRRRRER